MLHCFKYSFLTLIRTKVVVFWGLVFPIFLSVLYYSTFCSMQEKTESFNAIPVAVVGENAPESFSMLIDVLSQGEGAILAPEQLSMDQGMEKLEREEVQGIFFYDNNIRLKVREGNSSIEAGILTSIASQFSAKSKMIENIAREHPEQLESVLKEISGESSAISPVSYRDIEENKSSYVQYFYNLLAMVALTAATSGIYCSIGNQANLSPLGMRKNVSPVNKLRTILASLLSTWLMQYICITIATLFIAFVLKIELGIPLYIILLINALSIAAGVSMGFFIGAIGAFGESVKSLFTITIMLVSCFLSGLMNEHMRMLVRENLPIVDRLNPATIITDSFYSLCVYDTYDRFWGNMLLLCGWCVVFITGGFLLTRKRKYKEL